MSTYIIQDTEAGNHIRTFNSYAQAIAALDRYEQKDREEGIYVPNYYQIVEAEPRTYDIVFNDNDDSNNKGFKKSLNDAYNYISYNMHNKWGYFQDYIGGTVSIVCNETGETICTEVIA